jgi:hypothetical protein
MKGTPITFCDDHAFVTGQYGFLKCPYCAAEDEAYNHGATSEETDANITLYEHRKLINEHAFYKEQYYLVKKLAWALAFIDVFLIITLVKHL